MTMKLPRAVVLNEAFAADRWLRFKLGTTVVDADEQSIRKYLDTIPVARRDTTLRALTRFLDDQVLKGLATRNAPRMIDLTDISWAQEDLNL